MNEVKRILLLRKYFLKTEPNNMCVFFSFTAVNCGTLTNPGNGRVSHTAGTMFRQTATYSCNAGYKLLGNSTRTCQATRLWSGSVPTCLGKSLLALYM